MNGATATSRDGLARAYPLTRRVLAAQIEGTKRRRVLAVIAAYCDEEHQPSVREIAKRAKVARSLRDSRQAIALIRRLESDGLLRVEWAKPPARNRYEIALSTERDR